MAYLSRRANKSDQILAILLRLVYPTPLAISGDDSGPPVAVRVISDDRLGVKP
jgi:hypothetical protein